MSARVDNSDLAPDTIAARGEEWLERIRDEVEPGNRGRFLAIDIETGDYEIDNDDFAAIQRAAKRHPGAVFYVTRIGYPWAHKLGRGSSPKPIC